MVTARKKVAMIEQAGAVTEEVIGLGSNASGEIPSPRNLRHFHSWIPYLGA